MQHLSIENFKCFYNAEIPINELTILAGANGNGKSTTIQALLLLRRTIEHCSEWKNGYFEYNTINGLNVELNGVYCLGLGNSENILPAEYDEPKIVLGLKDNSTGIKIRYNTNKGSELWITPEKFIENDFKFPQNSLLFQQFYYLNAERIGPRIAQSIKFYDYHNVGFRGEYTAQIIADIDSLESDENFTVDENRILKDDKF